MQQEIEIKFDVNNAQKKTVLQWVKEIYPEIETDIQKAHSTYFDTPNLDLKKQQSALRIRDMQGQLLQTFKIAHATEKAYLHQRTEIEFLISKPILNFDLFSEDIKKRLLPFKESLAPVFETRFQRTRFLISHQGALIELAVDEGEIIANQQKEKISEIELELKSGKISALQNFAKAFATKFSLTPSKHTKASRGYRLSEYDKKNY